MNLGNVPALIGSSYARPCRGGGPGRFQMWRPMCEEHCLWSFCHPSSWFLETADFTTSHDSLITEGVTAKLKARNPCMAEEAGWHWLLGYRRAGTCSPNGRISFLYFCSRNFSDGVMRVSLRTLYLVRTQRHCPDGPVSVSLDVEFASLVLRDDIGTLVA